MGGPKKPFRVIEIECPDCGKQILYITDRKEHEGTKMSGEEAVLEILKRESGLTYKDIAKGIHRNTRQVSRYLSSLLEKNKVEVDKEARYRIKIH